LKCPDPVHFQVPADTSNRLTYLSPEIGQLVNLRRLSLSHNQLTFLPPEIGQLSNLNELSLSYNQFTSFPLEIVQLERYLIIDVIFIKCWRLLLV
jgi:Leucine-rich repeat (LRR) protein